MLNIEKIIAGELNKKQNQVENALELRKNGATVPFIARYRKESTGGLDETELRDIFERYDYLSSLEERKKTVLDAIEKQGKLTPELKSKIENCLGKTELEDLYMPYRPKRRTRATIAKEKGLEPLADIIESKNVAESPKIDLEAESAKFVSKENSVETAADALKGASDIIAERVAENSELRGFARKYLYREGSFSAKIKEEFEVGSTKYEMYRTYSAPVSKIAAHNMLALRRGEKEGVLNIELNFDEDYLLEKMNAKTIFTKYQPLEDFYRNIVKDAFKRLMKNSIIGEIRLDRKKAADEESVSVFGTNLRQILLAPPAGMQTAMGIDPGIRTGCKVAVVDRTGKLLDYDAIYPFKSEKEKKRAVEILTSFLREWKVDFIAIGNGTAGRETDSFVGDILKTLDFDPNPVKVLVSEAGASVYSASETAKEEFPELDVSIRGAISIARRLQDPLAELVKIDPKSIGVGQYQHDVDQKLLRRKLDETIESCVNYVGVDLNTASKELLVRVSGLSESLAKNVVEYRNKRGAFTNRKQLLETPKFGAKAFEQSAGFLRIRDGENLLDNTAVHPESYYIVERIAEKMGLAGAYMELPKKLDRTRLADYATDGIGVPTLSDILTELEKPGRDPRAEFQYAEFDDSVKDIADLKIGMELEGVVTNITHFGAFVDVGAHQDGLVHKSEIADRFVADPAKFLKVGQIVKVKVLFVNENLRRVGLSIKQAERR